MMRSTLRKAPIVSLGLLLATGCGGTLRVGEVSSPTANDAAQATITALGVENEEARGRVTATALAVESTRLTAPATATALPTLAVASPVQSPPSASQVTPTASPSPLATTSVVAASTPQPPTPEVADWDGSEYGGGSLFEVRTGRISRAAQTTFAACGLGEASIRSHSAGASRQTAGPFYVSIEQGRLGPYIVRSQQLGPVLRLECFPMSQAASIPPGGSPAPGTSAMNVTVLPETASDGQVEYRITKATLSGRSLAIEIALQGRPSGIPIVTLTTRSGQRLAPAASNIQAGSDRGQFSLTFAVDPADQPFQLSIRGLQQPFELRLP